MHTLGAADLPQRAGSRARGLSPVASGYVAALWHRRQVLKNHCLETPVPIRPRLLRALGAASVGLALVGLAACGDDEPERDESTNEITEAGDADVFSMAVGDCVTDDAGATGEVSEVPVVPCSEPHASEVFHSYQITTDELPAEAEMQAIVEEQCLGTFETFVGLPYDQSALDINWLEPTSGSWDGGDRELLCMVFDPAGDVTGTLAGAAR